MRLHNKLSDPGLFGRANLANINQMSTYIYLAGPVRFNHVFRTLLSRVHGCHHEVWSRCYSQKNLGRKIQLMFTAGPRKSHEKPEIISLGLLFCYSFLHSLKTFNHLFIRLFTLKLCLMAKLSWMLSKIVETQPWSLKSI